TRQRPLGLSGSHEPLHPRDRPARDPGRDAGAYPARPGPAPCPRHGPAECERAWCARGGARLYPGPHVLSAGRGDTRAGPRAAGSVAVFFGTAPVVHRAANRGPPAALGATPPPPPALLPPPLYP